MAGWWAFCVETRTGRRVLGSPRVTVPFVALPRAGSRLNEAGPMSLTVKIGADLRAGDLAPYLASWRYSWGLAFGSDIVQCGPSVGDPQYDSRAETWSINCAGLRRLLEEKRLLTWDGPRTFEGSSLAQIKRAILADTLARDGGDLPVDLPDEADLAGDGEHTRTYEYSRAVRVGKAWDDLTDDVAGPEDSLRPYFADTTRMDMVRWQARIGTPNLVGNAAAPRPHVWRPGRILVQGYPGADQARVADNYWVPGASTADDFVMGSYTGTVLQDLGYPLLDDVDTSHTTEAGQDTLDGYAAGNASKYVLGGRTLDVVVTRDGVLGVAQDGDLVRAELTGYVGVPDGVYNCRLLGLAARDVETMDAEVQVLDGAM